MKKKFWLFFLGSSIFMGFVFFSYLVHKGLFIHFDFDTTIRLQDHVSRRFDDLFSLLSIIGRFEIVVLFLLFILLIKRKLRGIFVLLLFIGFHILELYGKIFVQHPPPPYFMLRTKQIANFPQFYIEASNSYPSGHAARAVFVSVILLFFAFGTKKLGGLGRLGVLVAIIIYDSIMLFSRVYLGEHWASDVMGGSLLGASLGLLSVVVF